MFFTNVTLMFSYLTDGIFVVICHILGTLILLLSFIVSKLIGFCKFGLNQPVDKIKNETFSNEGNKINQEFNSNKNNASDSMNISELNSNDIKCTSAFRRDEESQTCNEGNNSFYENDEFESNLMQINTFDGLTISEVRSTVHILHMLL